MNILITTQHGDVAGATFSVFLLAKGLSTKGHKVILACRPNSVLHRLATQSSIKCHNIVFNNKFDVCIWRNISQIIKSENIDLVYAQESKDRYACIFSKIFFRYQAKLFLARRQKVVDNNPFKRLLYNYFSNGQIIISEGLKKEMIKLGFPESKMKVIFNGLPEIRYRQDHTSIDKLREKYHIEDGDIIIGCVARPKRQDDLFAVLQRLPSNYKLLLVGITREQVETFFLSADAIGLGKRLIVAGIITNKKVLYDHYKLMAIHVLSSDMDGFGLVNLEAMQLAIPVIGANYGGIPDVIQNQVSGFIYELGNITQLKNQIITLIHNKRLSGDFVKEGLKRAKKFSIESTVNNYESYFSQSLIGND
jgi:glycosyltransferase involved in cell wall biosynthesis